jgi:hypothetical protein
MVQTSPMKSPSFAAALSAIAMQALAGCTLAGCSPAAPQVVPPASRATTRAEERPSATAAPQVSASATAEAAPSSAPAASAPEPISGDLPADLDAKLVIHAVCKDRECLVPGLYPAGAAADGGAPAAIWSHDLPDKGTTITFPRHSGVDLYGVVLAGKVRIKPLEPGARAVDLARWGALRAPGAGVSVVAPEGAARMVLAVAGDGAPIAETAAQLKDRKTLKLVAWQTRPSAVETSDLSAATDLAWARGAMHARIGFEGGGRASFGILFASKDAAVAPHTHDASWEILAPLTADGTLKRASSAGASELTEVAVTDGTVIAMPKATLHQWLPGGKKPLFAVQMYVPPGPEQRFKKLAADAPK